MHSDIAIQIFSKIFKKLDRKWDTFIEKVK